MSRRDAPGRAGYGDDRTRIEIPRARERGSRSESGRDAPSDYSSRLRSNGTADPDPAPPGTPSSCSQGISRREW